MNKSAYYSMLLDKLYSCIADKSIATDKVYLDAYNQLKLVLSSDEKYDVYSKFDYAKHNLTFTHYFEAVILPDGTVEYAVPSHQEKLIDYLCKRDNITRDKLEEQCPSEYYFNYAVWLVQRTGCIACWSDRMICPEEITKEQIITLNKLIEYKILEVK